VALAGGTQQELPQTIADATLQMHAWPSHVASLGQALVQLPQ
jgi:hypothetical protein